MPKIERALLSFVRWFLAQRLESSDAELRFEAFDVKTTMR
jgi:hypothetical protein